MDAWSLFLDRHLDFYSHLFGILNILSRYLNFFDCRIVYVGTQLRNI